jgi:hypothetical protein
VGAGGRRWAPGRRSSPGPAATDRIEASGFDRTPVPSGDVLASADTQAVVALTPAVP